VVVHNGLDVFEVPVVVSQVTDVDVVETRSGWGVDEMFDEMVMQALGAAWNVSTAHDLKVLDRVFECHQRLHGALGSSRVSSSSLQYTVAAPTARCTWRCPSPTTGALRP
jgi:hypothetical protein